MFESKLYKQYYPVKSEEQKEKVIRIHYAEFRKILRTEILINEYSLNEYSIERACKELLMKLYLQTLSTDELNVILSLGNRRHKETCIKNCILILMSIAAVFLFKQINLQI